MGRVEAREFLLKDGRRGVIRTAEERDAELLSKQIVSVLEEAEYTISTYPEDGANYTAEKEKEWIEKHKDGDSKLFLVAEIDGKIAGSTDLRNSERKRIQHVCSMGITVLKNCRDLGVGKALMETAIEWASEHPVIEKIALAVFANNARAINVYKKFGFVEEGRKIKEIRVGPDEYVDSILMYKFVK